MPSPPYVLALDQGTTSSRALLVDAGGSVAAVENVEFPQLFPRPGWVEHDPLAIWESQETAAARVLERAGVRSGELAAVGITNQRETTLLWRRGDGRPLHNAIVWQDRRTADRCRRIVEEGHADDLRARTGLLPDPYFSGTKLEWLLDHVPDARTAADPGELAFGTVDTWLLWKLTGGGRHATDRTNASRTLLWNLREERWDPALLDEFRVPEAVLPNVLQSRDDYGESELPGGLRAPVWGIAGDQQAALFGQAGWDAGTAKNTYGTGCFLLWNTGENAPEPAEGLLATAACGRGGRRAYAVEGSVFVAGAAVQWLRDGLGLIGSAAETEGLARSVPDTQGVHVVPAFTGLGAPYWDSHARGTIVGLTRGAGRAHLVRATLEGIAHQVCDVVDAMTAGHALASLRVDGGASENDFLMQTQADLLGIRVERAAVRETTALGAAYLAGLGCGLWRQEELARLWKADRVFEPAISPGEREERRAGWRRAVERARGWTEE